MKPMGWMVVGALAVLASQHALRAFQRGRGLGDYNPYGSYDPVRWEGYNIRNAGDLEKKFARLNDIRSGYARNVNEGRAGAKFDLWGAYLNEPIFSDVPQREWYD